MNAEDVSAFIQKFDNVPQTDFLGWFLEHVRTVLLKRVLAASD